MNLFDTLENYKKAYALIGDHCVEVFKAPSGGDGYMLEIDGLSIGYQGYGETMYVFDSVEDIENKIAQHIPRYEANMGIWRRQLKLTDEAISMPKQYRSTAELKLALEAVNERIKLGMPEFRQNMLAVRIYKALAESIDWHQQPS